MAAPHKIVLKELIERLEAVVVRMEAALGPPAEMIPVDPTAQAAADKYIEQRKFELGVENVDG